MLPLQNNSQGLHCSHRTHTYSCDFISSSQQAQRNERKCTLPAARERKIPHAAALCSHVDVCVLEGFMLKAGKQPCSSYSLTW